MIGEIKYYCRVCGGEVKEPELPRYLGELVHIDTKVTYDHEVVYGHSFGRVFITPQDAATLLDLDVSGN